MTLSHYLQSSSFCWITLTHSYLKKTKYKNEIYYNLLFICELLEDRTHSFISELLTSDTLPDHFNTNKILKTKEWLKSPQCPANEMFVLFNLYSLQKFSSKRRKIGWWVHVLVNYLQGRPNGRWWSRTKRDLFKEDGLDSNDREKCTSCRNMYGVCCKIVGCDQMGNFRGSNLGWG